jgi:hypothetical protein
MRDFNREHMRKKRAKEKAAYEAAKLKAQIFTTDFDALLLERLKRA